MSDESQIPVHRVDWAREEVSLDPIPSASGSFPAAPGGSNLSGDQPAVAFRDEHDNVITAVSDGAGGWKVDFVRMGAWAKLYRTQITTAVKGLAYALLASGNIAKSLGHNNLGEGLQKAGNVTNTATALSDVAHYGHSAFQTYRKEGLTVATFKDLGKALGQTLGLGAGAMAALSPSESVQAGANLATFAAIAATGRTVQEKKQADEDARRLFYRHSREEAMIGVNGTPVPLRGGSRTPSTTTGFSPPITRTNTAQFNPPFRRDTGHSSDGASSRSRQHYGGPVPPGGSSVPKR
ncbi:hypothetical protein P3L51_35675 [Streptomyces sp. PSRA5]|uniref:hypothetical protein n=1 Tax=Streptomyces panacea TaxID=3035064 RepID=UPI00339D1B96